MRSVYCSDQLVKFQLHRRTVPILSVLDQEHHEERDDGRAGIYNQLPGIAKANIGPVAAQTKMMSTARAKVAGCPAAREVRLANRVKRES